MQCTDAQILTRKSIEGKEMRNQKKKVNEETGTELLINQGVDVRFQNIWQVEYQRVKD